MLQKAKKKNRKKESATKVKQFQNRELRLKDGENKSEKTLDTNAIHNKLLYCSQ